MCNRKEWTAKKKKKQWEKDEQSNRDLARECEQAMYRKKLHDKKMSHDFTNKAPVKWQSLLIRHTALGVSTVN